MCIFLTNLLEKEEERVGKEKVEEVGTDYGVHVCLCLGPFAFDPPNKPATDALPIRKVNKQLKVK